MKPFDTLSYCKQLEAAGIPREQAEVQAQALGEVMSQIVTTTDLASFEARIKPSTKSYIKEQSQRLGSNADIGLWMLAISIAQTSLIIAALRYLPH